MSRLRAGSFGFPPGDTVRESSAVKTLSTAPHKKGVDPHKVLSEEELEIARLVIRGLSTKEIAEAKQLTVRSLDKHRANIMEKLGVKQVAGIVRLCVLNGIT